MLAFIQQTKELRIRVEQELLQCKETWKKHSHKEAWRQNLLANLGRFIDFGKVAETYELCEQLLSHWQRLPQFVQVPESYGEERTGWGGIWLTCKIYLAHLDLARKKDIEKHRSFFQNLASNPDPYFAAHAQSALGLLALFSWETDAASECFQNASKLFTQAQFPVDALKMKVREIMVLRMLNEIEAANTAINETLKDALSVGPEAVAPILFCYAALGSNLIEQGKKFEAQRYLREGAKIARVMPPSQSSTFAIFQYGNVLVKLGKHAEGCVWLEEAEKAQRTLDQMARYGTLILLLQCYRSERQWSKALATVGQLLVNKSKELHDEDLAEATEQSILCYLDVYEFETARQLFEKSTELLKDFPALRQELDLEFAKAEARAKVSRKFAAPLKSEKTIVLDFQKGRVLVKTGIQQCEEVGFSPESGAALLLELFIAARAGGEKGLPVEFLKQKLGEASLEAKPESVQKKLVRNLQAFEKLGIVHKAADIGETLFALCEEADVYLLKSE